MKSKFPFQSSSMATSRHCRLRPLRTIHLTLGLVAALSPLAPATAITWIGGNVDWIDNGTATNWSPADEPDSNDDVIFNTANTLNLGSSNTVLSLTLSGGSSLKTNEFDLTVDGLLQLQGAGTDVTIGGSASSVTADNVGIYADAKIILAGGVLNVIEETGFGRLNIYAGGKLAGHGTINLQDGLAGPTTLMSNYGTLSASDEGKWFPPLSAPCM